MPWCYSARRPQSSGFFSTESTGPLSGSGWPGFNAPLPGHLKWNVEETPFMPFCPALLVYCTETATLVDAVTFELASVAVMVKV
jgi:hypothetical protein